MKLFKYICGADERYGIAADEQDAYAKRAKIDPTFHFLNVRIEEVSVPGYKITITPDNSIKDEFDDMDKAALRAWLDSRNIEYTPQLGESKLREVARAASK